MHRMIGIHTVSTEMTHLRGYEACFLRATNTADTSTRIAASTARLSVSELQSGVRPVFGNPGAATTTVADERSIAVKPLALPSAVPIFVVVWVKFV